MADMYAVHREIRRIEAANQGHTAADTEERLSAEASILRTAVEATAKLPIISYGFGPRYARFAMRAIKRLRARWLQNEVG